MIWPVTLLLILGACLLVLYWKLLRHPHMEPLRKASPVIAPMIEQMVREISLSAGVDPPTVHVIRARVPNAYVILPFRRGRLVLADELLEEADRRSDGLQYLERVVCHEVAHIALGHAPVTVFWNLLGILAPLPVVRPSVTKRLQRIEKEADDLAADIHQRLQRNRNGAT